MDFKKMIIVLVAAVFQATIAFADNCPEYEALCDSTNIFADNSPLQYGDVTDFQEAEGYEINRYSSFDGEYFAPPANKQSRIDFCFHSEDRPYRSYRTEPHTPGTYEWRFALQTIPESDINVTIYNCVLKPQGTDIFTEAQQTGRVNMPDGSTRFFRSQNPRITVTAEAGDHRFPSFVMTARKMPNLGSVATDDKLFTIKAHWEESLVLELPATGRSKWMRRSLWKSSPLSQTPLVPRSPKATSS